jgi:4-hydroxy-3-polyprenylbenzoate decarboxylase
MSGGKKIIVAVTGASGAIYARQLLERLAALPEIERIALIISRHGQQVAAWEGVGFSGFSENSPQNPPQNSPGIQPQNPQQTDDAVISDRRPPQRRDETSLAGGVPVERLGNDDMFASVASGSAGWEAMVIVPCSMGCVGRIAAGVSSDLISRAADVMLKEGRGLVVVPRETPLSIIHLRNLTTLAQAGAAILPASPSFYSRPADIESLCATVTERILSRLGIKSPHYEWGNSEI